MAHGQCFFHAFPPPGGRTASAAVSLSICHSPFGNLISPHVDQKKTKLNITGHLTNVKHCIVRNRLAETNAYGAGPGALSTHRPRPSSSSSTGSVAARGLDYEDENTSPNSQKIQFTEGLALTARTWIYADARWRNKTDIRHTITINSRPAKEYWRPHPLFAAVAIINNASRIRRSRADAGMAPRCAFRHHAASAWLEKDLPVFARPTPGTSVCPGCRRVRRSAILLYAQA